MSQHKKVKEFMGGFRKFISRGSVVDMAVGIIIGSAFTSIVNSLVKDVIMPFIGVLVGGINFSDLKIILLPASVETSEVAIYYGNLIQQVLNFLIISFVVFCIITIIGKLHFKKEEKLEAPPKKSEELMTLIEIKELLRDMK